MPSVTITMDDNLFKLVKKRAEKNLLNTKEQVEDIVRRSMLSYTDSRKLSLTKDVDDKLLNIFSRQRRGRKKIKKYRPLKFF